MEALEKHHISHKPDTTILITRRKHQEIHGIVPKTDELRLLMKKYERLEKLSRLLNQWRTAFRKDFGDLIEFDFFNETIIEITKKKKELLKLSYLLIKQEYKLLHHIKGLSIRGLSLLFGQSHPRDFHCKNAYLAYCGYRGGRTKFNRQAKSTVWFMAVQTIKHKDPTFYPIYLKLRHDMTPKDDVVIKWLINRKAINRLGTLILKYIYEMVTSFLCEKSKLLVSCDKQSGEPLSYSYINDTKISLGVLEAKEGSGESKEAQT